MGGVKASHFLLFSMITLLYLNDSEGEPYITTCPVDKLIKKKKKVIVVIVELLGFLYMI